MMYRDGIKAVLQTLLTHLRPTVRFSILEFMIFLGGSPLLYAQSLQSDSLFAKGVEAYSSGKYGQAYDYFKRCDEIDGKEMPDKSCRKYYSCDWMASSLYMQGKEEEAYKLTHYYYLVPTDRRMTALSDSIKDAGYDYYNSSDFPKVLECFLKASEIERTTIGDSSPLYANTLFSIGDAYYATGDTEKAVEYYKECLGKSLCHYDAWSEYINDLANYIVYLHPQTGYREVSDIFKDILHKTDLHYEWYDALKLRTIIAAYQAYDLDYLEEQQTKENDYDPLEECAKRHGEPSRHFLSQTSQAFNLYQSLGAGLEAYTIGNRYLAAAREMGRKDSLTISVMLGMAEQFTAEFQFNMGLSMAEKALKMAEDLQSPTCISEAHLQIARTCVKSGDYENALKHVEAGISPYHQRLLNDSINYLNTLHTLMNVYTGLGDWYHEYENAAKALELTMNLYGEESTETFREYVVFLRLYAQYGDIREPLSYVWALYDKLISDNRLFMGGDIYGAFYSIIDLINISRRVLTSDSEIEYFIRCTKQIRKILLDIEAYGKKHSITLDVTMTLADLLWDNGKTNDAIKLYLDIADIQKDYYERDDWGIKYKIGLAYLETGKAKKAFPYLRDVVKDIGKNVKENFRWMTSNSRADFWELICLPITDFTSYALAADLEKDFVTEAYDATLLSKGILLNSEVELQKLITDSGNKETIEAMNKWRELKERIDKFQRERNLSENSKLDLHRLQTTADSLESQLMLSLKEFGDYTKGLSINYKEVQRCLAPTDVAIEFAIAQVPPVDKNSRAYYVALVLESTGHPHMVKLIEYNRLAEAVKNKAITDSLIYWDIWQPLEIYIRGKLRIFFSPVLDFHALGLEYVQELSAYELYRLSSTRELVTHQASDILAQVAIFGGARFDMALTDNIAVTINTYRDVPNLRKARGAMMSVPDLPGSRQEAEEISRLMKNKGITASLNTDDACTEESFKSLSGKKISTIHISTHGFFEEYDSIADSQIDETFYTMQGMEEASLSRSGLLLSGAENTLFGSEAHAIEDGILTAKEISRLDFRGLALVVLSACKTALGDVSGDGVFGLQRGFKKAGAQTLVMSLWEVDDEATRLMMTEFYRNLIDGQKKREAFLNAQKRLRQYDKGQYDKPEYWAAFIMLDGID